MSPGLDPPPPTTVQTTYLVMQEVHPPASFPLNKIHGPGHPSLKRKWGGKISQREVGERWAQGSPKKRGPVSRNQRDRGRQRAECWQPPEVPAARSSHRKPIQLPSPLSPLFSRGSWLSTRQSYSGEIKHRLPPEVQSRMLPGEQTT